MSFGSSPEYVQTTLTTGMLMLGNMSVGVRSADREPKIAMKSARTPQGNLNNPHPGYLVSLVSHAPHASEPVEAKPTPNQTRPSWRLKIRRSAIVLVEPCSIRLRA
jgi:hypothetical protein